MASRKYSLKFINEPNESLMCLICHELAQNPIQHDKCGKLFCRKCMEDNENLRGKDRPCPNCMREAPHYYNDGKSYAAIREIEIKCCNVDEGCSWLGTVGTIEDHMTECEFSPVSCKYVNIGCPVQSTKKGIEEHEENDNKAHLHVALEAVSGFKGHADNICLSTNSHLQNVLNMSKSSAIVKLDRFRHMKEYDLEFESAPFYSSSHGYKMRVYIYANGIKDGKDSHVSVYIGFFDTGPYYDNHPHWPFMGSINVELLNQLADDSHYLDMIPILCAKPDAKISMGISRFIPHALLSNEFNSELDDQPANNSLIEYEVGSESERHYLVNDVLYFRVSIELYEHKTWLHCSTSQMALLRSMKVEDTLPFLQKTAPSLNNTISTVECSTSSLESMISSIEAKIVTLSEGELFKFELTQYEAKKKANEEFYSFPFYTHPSGYKMCIKVYPNGEGNGKGKHVSVFVTIEKGPYDSQLHWPFLGMVRLELLNQHINKNHHSKEVVIKDATGDHASNNCWGYTNFFPQPRLSRNSASNMQYLKDDTLRFRVSVQLADRKPSLDCNICHEAQQTVAQFQSLKLNISSIEDDVSRLQIRACTLRQGDSKTYKVNGFEAKRRNDDIFQSDAFYTCGGYKMCLKVHFNGDFFGNGTHVSIFSPILQGPYDDQLHWPFKGLIIFELLNQLADENHHRQTFSVSTQHNAQVGSSKGFSKFVLHSALSHNPAKHAQYLVNDTLYFRISVKVTDHKPWLDC